MRIVREELPGEVDEEVDDLVDDLARPKITTASILSTQKSTNENGERTTA